MPEMKKMMKEMKAHMTAMQSTMRSMEEMMGAEEFETAFDAEAKAGAAPKAHGKM